MNKIKLYLLILLTCSIAFAAIEYRDMTFQKDVFVDGNLSVTYKSTGQGELRLRELSTNGTNYLGFKAPTSLSGNQIWTLPSADGTSGYPLITNGAGVTSWSTVSIAAGGTGQVTASSAFDALSPLTTKGDLVVRNASVTTRHGVGSNDQALIADSAQTNGIKWGTLAIAGGGTGQITKGSAFDALSPLTTKGDLIVSNGSTTTRLAVGTNNQVLTAASGEAFGVKWADGGGSGGGDRMLVDATIVGSNPTLSTSNVSTFTEITDANATLANTGKGTLTASIPCSTTNPPTGTTCSAGSESFGVAFTLASNRKVRVCAEWGATYLTGSGGSLRITYQLIQTPTNAQTITSEGGSRPVLSHSVASSSMPQTHNTCGIFSLSSGDNVIRLMYELGVSGTVIENQIINDGDSATGQRNMHFWVEALD